MRFFGTHYVSGCAEVNRVDAPVGSLCGHCGEPIEPQDDGWLVPYYGKQDDPPELPYHRACFLRQVLGSVAHQQRLCSCYIPGSTAEDDPTLTPRQAAQAAVAEFQKSPSLSESVPIDLNRYEQALADIEQIVDELVGTPTREGWASARERYRLALVVYNMMSVTQQSNVEARLEAIRQRIDALNYQDH